MRIYQLLRFELVHGRHVGRLGQCYDDDILKRGVRRSAHWSKDAEESRSDIAAALAFPANRSALLMLAGVPDDSKIDWAIREVGSAGAMDMVSLVRNSSGGDVLLLLDCMGAQASPARLREQMAQAVRNALSTLSKATFGNYPSWTKLVVLSGWRQGVPEPTEANPLPALQRELAILDPVPEPQLWGYVPFVGVRDDELFVAFGRWHEFEEEPWLSMPTELVPVPWESWDPVSIQGWGKGAAVELEQHRGHVRVSLRIKSSEHKASMKKDRHGSIIANRVRALRSSCYSGHFIVGAGRFVGETIEGGVPRLHWDWAAGQIKDPEAARDIVIKALDAVGKIKAESEDPASEEPASEEPASEDPASDAP
jgi:hypothetical protein